MSVRRGSLKLKALGKTHGQLHILLWQAREAQSTIMAAAVAQKTLFSDIAAWASSENRAISDVCACASELSSIYSGALSQLALAFKSFRKEMSLVLEGERRCDTTQKKLQDAEQKRIKLRRQVLRAQNRSINEGSRQSGDFTQLQTQLAEAERTAERAHLEACETSREQESVKLVVMRNALTKLCQSHLTLSSQTKVIFEGDCELANLLPEPPPPGDPLSCIRYCSYDAAKGIVNRVKQQITFENGGGIGTLSRRSSGASSRPVSTSTPLTSPNSSMWSGEPSAPQQVYSPTEPPPPYNTNYISPNQGQPSHSRHSASFNVSNPSPRRMERSHHVHCPNRSSENFENCSSSSSPNSSSLCSSMHQSFNSMNITCDNGDDNQSYRHHRHLRNHSSASVSLFRCNEAPEDNISSSRSYAILPST